MREKSTLINKTGLGRLIRLEVAEGDKGRSALAYSQHPSSMTSDLSLTLTLLLPL